MKNISKILLIFFASLLTACEGEKYENVFDETPAQRRKEYYEQLRATLTGAENGWIMQYFSWETGRGYNLFTAFNETGDVIIGAKNTTTDNVYKEYTGKYNLTYENGPALVFTTYNDALHIFANPDPYLFFPYKPVEDFEFVVYNLKNDTIRIRGKRTNIEVVLISLPADMTGEQYILQAEETKHFICPKGGPELILETEGKTYTFTEVDTSIFNIRETESNETLRFSFIETADGFRLYSALEINDKKLQNFQLINNRNDLICTDDLTAKFHIEPNGVDFFLQSIKLEANAWNIDKNNIGGVFAEAYTQIVNNCKNKYKEDFESLFIAYKRGQGATISFKSGEYTGRFNFSIEMKEGTTDQIVFTYANSADKNGNLYLNNIPGFNTFINELKRDTYIISQESNISVSTFKFTQVSNPDNWFRVRLNY